MIKSILKTKGITESFYYLVEVYISTFNVYESYVHSEVIRCEDLMEAREKAHKRREELISNLEKQGMFFLPFASQQNFVQGENACYSVDLFLIHDIDGEEDIHAIIGHGDCSSISALKFEKEIFERLKN
jgi:hypothetical protein